MNCNGLACICCFASAASIWGFSRLSAVATRQGDLPYGICLLTFRDPKMEEQYRSTRLIRRTSSTLWISFLFLLVLSSLWPVYGKVLCILGASERISLSFSVGCGALIAAWVFHACIVAFRKKMGISDKAAIQFTLALIALVSVQCNIPVCTLPFCYHQCKYATLCSAFYWRHISVTIAMSTKISVTTCLHLFCPSSHWLSLSLILHVHRTERLLFASVPFP